ncbi:MAG: hypothetical protein E6R04_09775 [Spirochaetes bacterium]|nr:MAG: hypothetical protein E6R04_09775 [Spirochaetota bacterium]
MPIPTPNVVTLLEIIGHDGVPEKLGPLTDRDVQLTHLLTLLQNDYTTVTVRYTQATPRGDMATRAYTYKAPKSMELVPGDHVLVFAKDTPLVGRVVKVDDEPDVDFTRPYALKWVVQKLDFTQYEQQQEREAAAIRHLRSSRSRKAREQMLRDLIGDEDRERIAKLLNGEG